MKANHPNENEADLEQMAQEDAIWPWLANDSMADETIEPNQDDEN